MRSFFFRSSLIIPLVCALMVASESGKFTIKNVETGLAIAAIHVAEGHPVQTATNKPITLTINPKPGQLITLSTIYDEKTHLYVGANKLAPGSHLIWVRDTYTWNVSRMDSGDYVFYPIVSEVYWSQNSTIAPEVELIPGREVRGKEAFWALQKAHTS